jgi:PIN domain nuclease of toxin-antitoxin system
MSATISALIADGENDIVFSAVSAWEISIKNSLGRLPDMGEDAQIYVPSRVSHYGFRVLPIEVSHALRAGSLPPIHRDPFDRLLVAQSQLENLPILTSDARIAAYGVEVIW